MGRAAPSATCAGTGSGGTHTGRGQGWLSAPHLLGLSSYLVPAESHAALPHLSSQPQKPQCWGRDRMSQSCGVSGVQNRGWSHTGLPQEQNGSRSAPHPPSWPWLFAGTGGTEGPSSSPLSKPADVSTGLSSFIVGRQAPSCHMASAISQETSLKIKKKGKENNNKRTTF